MTSGTRRNVVSVRGWSEYLSGLKDSDADQWNPFDTLQIKGHHELAYGWGENKYHNPDSRHVRLFHYGSNWLGSDDAGFIKFKIKQGFKVKISLIPETYLATESRYFDSNRGVKWNFCELDSRRKGGLYRGNSPPPPELLMYGNGRTGYKKRYYSCMTFEMAYGDELILDVADDFRGTIDGGIKVYSLTVNGQSAGSQISDDIDENVVVSITEISKVDEKVSVDERKILTSFPKHTDAIATPVYITEPLEEVELRRGNRGPSVKELQRILNLLGLVEDVDGIFGKKTEAAVIRLQSMMVTHGGNAAERYENGVFDSNLYEDVKNFDPSHLTISNCKIETLQQYHAMSDPRDPFSRFEINGNHSFDASGAELDLLLHSSISMKIRDNWAVKLKIHVEHYDYFQDNLMMYKRTPMILSCHNPYSNPFGSTSYLEVQLCGGDELIFDVSGDYTFTPNFFLKLQGLEVSQNSPEAVGGRIRLEVFDVMTPQDVWVRYKTEKPVNWGRDHNYNFWDFITDALSIDEHLNNLGVDSTLEYGVGANVAVEFKVDVEQYFVIKNIDGTKYNLESTYKAGVGVEPGGTRFGFGKKNSDGKIDRSKSAPIDIGGGVSVYAGLYGSWSTVYEYPNIDSLKDSIYFFLLGPLYSKYPLIELAIDSYSLATGTYSTVGNKFTIGALADASIVLGFGLDTSGDGSANENGLTYVGGEIGGSGSVSSVIDFDYVNNKLSQGLEITGDESVSAGLLLGFMSSSEEGRNFEVSGPNFFNFGGGYKVEVITHSITYSSMDANDPLKPFIDSESKLSFDLTSSDFGTITLHSPMEQIKITFYGSTKQEFSTRDITYEFVLDLKTSFLQMVNILKALKQKTPIYEILESMPSVITDISLEVNKIESSGFGNLGLDVKYLGVGGGLSITQTQADKTAFFTDANGTAVPYAPPATDENGNALTPLQRIVDVKNKLYEILGINLDGE